MKIRPVAAVLFHADGQADMKLTAAICNFANEPKTCETRGSNVGRIQTDR